jgi:hypothetical protein
MLIKLFITVAALLLMLVGWVAIQSAARRTAERHPECGPFREAGGGCGGGKGCGSTTCASRPGNNELDANPNQGDQQ